MTKQTEATILYFATNICGIMLAILADEFAGCLASGSVMWACGFMSFYFLKSLSRL